MSTYLAIPLALGEHLVTVGKIFNEQTNQTFNHNLNKIQQMSPVEPPKCKGTLIFYVPFSLLDTRICSIICG
jgi:hypothetical protein